MISKNNKKSAFLAFFKNIIIFWFGINFIVLVNTRFFALLGINLPKIPLEVILVIAFFPALFFTIFPNIAKNTMFLNRGEKYVKLKTAFKAFLKISFADKCIYLFSLILTAIFIESIASATSMYIGTLLGKNVSILTYALFIIFIILYLVLLFKTKTFKDINSFESGLINE